MPNFEVKLLDLSKDQLGQVEALKSAIIELSSQNTKFFTQAKDGEFSEMPPVARNDGVLFKFVLGNIFSMNVQFVMAAVPTDPIFVSEQERADCGPDQPPFVTSTSYTITAFAKNLENSKSPLAEEENADDTELTFADRQSPKDDCVILDFTKPTAGDISRKDKLMFKIVTDEARHEQFLEMVSRLREMQSTTSVPSSISLGEPQERWVKGAECLYENKQKVIEYFKSKKSLHREELSTLLSEALSTEAITAKGLVPEFLNAHYREFISWVLRVEKYLACH